MQNMILHFQITNLLFFCNTMYIVPLACVLEKDANHDELFISICREPLPLPSNYFDKVIFHKRIYLRARMYVSVCIYWTAVFKI